MDIESFRSYCLYKAGTTEEFPFDESTLVFKVMGKIFAITGLDDLEFKVSLKCDPDWAIDLRESFPQIVPGFHMNKKHWNTVSFEADLPEMLLREMIDHSYQLVVNGLSAKAKKTLSQLQ